MELKKNLIVFDLETTGTWVDKDRIVEIAMIKCEPDGTQITYHKRVNPEMPIPPVVTELIGISNDDIKDAPKFREIVDEILEFIGDSDFAGFNVERFDLPLLEREVSDAGKYLDWRSKNVFDAQKVYHVNEKRDLTSAYKFYCDQSLDNAHSALADTQATLAILEKQVQQYGKGNEALDVLSEFNYRASNEFYDNERKFRWWNGKLYMMFGKYARKYSLQDIVKKDSGYLQWILSANFSDEIKELVDNALNGRFPQYSEKEKTIEA